MHAWAPSTQYNITWALLMEKNIYFLLALYCLAALQLQGEVKNIKMS